jgi:hypothetical protein
MKLLKFKIGLECMVAIFFIFIKNNDKNKKIFKKSLLQITTSISFSFIIFLNKKKLFIFSKIFIFSLLFK